MFFLFVQYMYSSLHRQYLTRQYLTSRSMSCKSLSSPYADSCLNKNKQIHLWKNLPANYRSHHSLSIIGWNTFFLKAEIIQLNLQVLQLFGRSGDEDEDAEPENCAAPLTCKVRSENCAAPLTCKVKSENCAAPLTCNLITGGLYCSSALAIYTMKLVL